MKTKTVGDEKLGRVPDHIFGLRWQIQLEKLDDGCDDGLKALFDDLYQPLRNGEDMKVSVRCAYHLEMLI